MRQLTPEGKAYLAEGLPERRLLERLRGPTPLRDLQGMPGFSIALQWAKKNGWVTIEKGNVVPVKAPSRYPLEEALRTLAAGGAAEPALLQALQDRRLIADVREGVAERAAKQVKEGATALTSELLQSGRWRDAAFKPYNVAATGARAYPGRRHPYRAYLGQVRRQLTDMGFREMTGPVVETEFWNFDALFQPQHHPSRDWTETYALKHPAHGSLPPAPLVKQVQTAHERGLAGSRGWQYRWDPRKAAKLMPRAHGTALSARTLASGPDIPGKYFAIVRCFRPDVIDATHGVEFNQTEGIVLDPSLAFTHLLGLLKEFAQELAGAEEIRFLPDYYPFTAPSVQMSAKHPRLGWVEFGGAGVFREELTAALGIQVPVIAWGIGIDRLAMFKLGISDIRELFSRNLQWLRDAPVGGTHARH